MYINDVHIAYYVVAAILGLFVGQFVDWMNKRLPEYKKVFTLDFFRKTKAEFKPNYILMLLTAIIFVTIIYIYGIKDTIIANLDLIKYLILAPMLLSAFVIDYKYQIIPNRLNLTIFEIGLIFTFLYGLSDVAISINMLLGMLARRRNILTNNTSRRIILWKRSHGIWRRKINGSSRSLFWIIKYYCYNTIIFFNRSNLKHYFISHKNKEI